MAKYGIVIIGRNEAERLPDCFESVTNPDIPVVYVDSGSTDHSVDIAKSAGVLVHELDPIKPFSAARARNEGFQLLLKKFPDLEAVQFIDGDCVFIESWMENGFNTLKSDETIGAVVGHLNEKYPDKSDYNRLCSLEWKSPIGDMEDFGGFGGISMIRATVFKDLGGYNPDIIAGEDSDFGLRISAAGFRVHKIDVNMAIHDAEITKFSQWWQRAVRAGHAIGQRGFTSKSAGNADMEKEIKSTWVWGGILPLIIIVGLIPSSGFSLLLLGLYGYLLYRIYSYRRGMGDTQNHAWVYSKYTLLGKIANMVGLLKFYVNKFLNRYHIIEYK